MGSAKWVSYLRTKTCGWGVGGCFRLRGSFPVWGW